MTAAELIAFLGRLPPDTLVTVHAPDGRCVPASRVAAVLLVEWPIPAPPGTELLAVVEAADAADEPAPPG